MDITLEVDRVGDDDVITVGGELDMYTVPRLRQAIADVAGDGPLSIVLDFQGVEFIDSTGLGVLVGALRRVRQSEGRLVIRGLRPNVFKVFEITGLDEVFGLERPESR